MGELCSPEEVAALEPLLPPTVTNIWWRLFSREPMPNLTMGARLSALVRFLPYGSNTAGAGYMKT